MSRSSARLQARRLANRNRAILAALEPRILMHGGLNDGDGGDLGIMLDPNIGYFPAMDAVATTGVTGSIATSGPIAISALSKYHSRASATVKLFLDFDGAPAQSWGSYNPPAETAYSSDADNTMFSDAEQQQIYEIWARVAEKYSPFNIDVTTEDPGNRTANQTLEVIFASEDGSAWLGGLSGGVAYIGSFNGYANNSVYVFPMSLGPYVPKYVAEAAAHESGHGFGLNHQSTYSGTTKTNEYNPGTSLTAPIMGNSYSAQRGLWWYGTSSSGSTTIQDDLAVISSSTNGFGYRTDDHPNTISSGDALTLSGTSVAGSGVIERMTDSDVFAFTTGAGAIQLTVNSADYGGMLNLKLDLYTSGGQLVSSVNSAVLGETLNVTVNAGTYKLVVSSNGAYGDVGQYTISGNIVAPLAPAVAAPTGLAAVVNNGQVALTWSDSNSSETGVVVQRSTDGGVNFVDYVTLGAGSTSYTDTGVLAGATYAYRVYVVNGSDHSDPSSSTSATLAPAAPGSLLASASSATQINLSWADVSGETGYRIDRSTDGVNFNTVATVGANVLSYVNTGLSASTKYYYRVVATNAGGVSGASPVASATTQAAVVTPLNAPTNLVSSFQKNGRIKLNWTDTNNNESGYKIEISTNGVNFTALATVGANATNFQTDRVTGGQTYWFRVKAYNATTESVYSNVSQVIARGAAIENSTPVGGVRHVGGFVKLPRIRR